MTPVLLALIAGPLMVGLVLAARYAESLAWRRSLVAFRLSLPSGMTPDDITRWLNTVAAATHAQRWALLPDPPIALEIAANAGIEHLLLVPAKMRATVLSGIRATLPGVRLDEAPDYLKYRPRFTVAAEAKLTNHRRQMAVDRAENTSTALLAALQPLYANEIVVVQWIIASAGTPARVPSAISTSMDSEAIRAARLKQTDTLLRVSLRVGVAAGSRARASAIFGRVWGQHRGLNAAGVLVVRRWWVWPRWAGIRMARLSTPVTSIWPIVLGSREAAGLLPLPVGLVALPGLTLGAARQLPPPREMPHRGTQLGLSNYPGMAKRRLCLSEHDRLQHVRVLGPTGVGKSTLLTNLILQDIAAGHAVVFIDLKGDACTDVLARVTGRRSDDLVVVDPAALSRPVGFNILRAGHDEQSRELVVDHVIHIWHELYRDFWGPRTEDVLRGALLTLVNAHAPDRSAFTLVDVPELLISPALRQFVIHQPGVPAGLDSFWGWYHSLKPADRLRVAGPVLNKLRAATLRSPIRLMLGQSEGLNLSRLLAERKVLLVPLRKGMLGTETASLLGTLILATLGQAILSRIRLPVGQRHPIFIYVDEAQDVLRLPVDLADMLAQARGLGAGFTLAHQHLGQVTNKEVKAALSGTVRSHVVFQCGRDDATVLATSFAPWLTASDLMGLAAHEAAILPCVDGQITAPVTGTTLDLPPPSRDAQALAEASRKRYGQPRAEIEAAIKARVRIDAGVESGNRATGTVSFGRRRKGTVPGGDRP